MADNETVVTPPTTWPETTRTEEAAAPVAEEQPEGIMAADEEFDENPHAHAFPWCTVIRWSIIVSVVALVIYLVTRRRD